MRRHNKIETVADFNLSISDLMAGLLSVFILTLCYFILNFNQATAQLTQSNVKRTELLTEIQQELKTSGIEVNVDTKHGILRIPEGVLFGIGDAEIKSNGQTLLFKLSGILSNVLSSEEFAGSVETVFVEGHTDNVPIYNDKFPSNWELSSKRAINTWLLMNKFQPELATMQNKNKQPMFSCSGYAETRPVAENSTEKGRAENRRIDLRFTMSPPTEEDQAIVKFVKKRISANEKL